MCVCLSVYAYMVPRSVDDERMKRNGEYWGYDAHSRMKEFQVVL